jgi:hypothetical protein
VRLGIVPRKEPFTGLNERIESLPPDMQTDVADFVEDLH